MTMTLRQTSKPNRSCKRLIKKSTACNISCVSKKLQLSKNMISVALEKGMVYIFLSMLLTGHYFTQFIKTPNFWNSDLKHTISQSEWETVMPPPPRRLTMDKIINGWCLLRLLGYDGSEQEPPTATGWLWGRGGVR